MIITTTPEMEKQIWWEKELIEFDDTLFKDGLTDETHFGFYDAYARMTAILQKNKENIDLLVLHIDQVVFGAILAFIDFVPKQSTSIEIETSNRRLGIWKANFRYHDCNIYGFFQHNYTRDSSSGIWYGRTISNIHLDLEHPEEKGIH